jgi:glycosyltransferase involved in cell wall biosynthesis
MLGECRRVFANAQNTANRVLKFNGLAAEALYHPPKLAARLAAATPAYGDFVLSVGRIESVKRVDLLVSAMARVDKPIRLVVAGDGTQRTNVERVAAEAGVAGRVEFLGAVEDEQLLALYRDALAVLYPPYDEDFGYVTLEAFLSRKPVITATDSGGPNEFVVDGVNGLVRAPDPEAFAEAINALARDKRRAASLGAAGYDRARTITWDGVIEKLVSQAGA